MEAQARNALRAIQDCLAADRYQVAVHFVRRMDMRGLFWPDVEAVIDSPASVHNDGSDRFGRAKWRVAGLATDGLELEVVCVLDRDELGNLAVFITAYWR